MKPRRQRMLAVVLIVVGVGSAAALALLALDENLLYFYDPSRIVAGEAPTDRTFRVGGMVVEGSVEREVGSLEVRFVLTDLEETVAVVYSGLLPDLFREGQGIIALGSLNGEGVFVADEVLAKHDENYLPPEVAQSLKKVHDKASDQGT